MISLTWKQLKIRCTAAALAVMLASVPVAPIAAAAEPIADTTVLVYMNGSDLESLDEAGAATDDLEEMLAVGSTGRTNIVVETGGTLAWVNSDISGEENQRWLVKRGELRLVEEGLGARNIGDPDTLKDFITWGVTKYPAKKYSLIFWNHGGGAVSGFGSDELFDYDSLLLPEIQTALQGAKRATGVTFELIGFDACLMATVETASMLKPYANYMVASEELEPGHGWNYTPILKHLTTRADWNGAALGRIIADSYKQQAKEQATDKEITLSVIDLSKIAQVEAALEQFITEASFDLEEPVRIKALAKARSRAEDYGSSGAHGGNTDMVDLVDLANKAAELYPEEAEKLIKSVQAATVYNINSATKPRAAGLSIYFPYKDKENFESNLEIYRTLGFSPAYQSFVESYVERMTEDKQSIYLEAPRALEDYESEEGTLYEVSITPEEMDEIAEAYSVIATYAEGSDSKLVFLGMDDTVIFNEENSTLEDTFTGWWVTLGGHFVSMFVTGYGDDFTEYSIPALLNGQEVDILVTYNYDTEATEIIGAWRGIDERSGMADKNIIKIKKGDTITPLFYTYDEVTEEEDYLEGDTFTVGDKLELEDTELPAGSYLFGFYLMDYAQNESYSDFIEIELME